MKIAAALIMINNATDFTQYAVIHSFCLSKGWPIHSDPSHSDWAPLSLTGLFIPSSTRLLTALPLWPRSAVSPSAYLSYPSDSLAHYLNPLNFSQSPLYAFSLILRLSRLIFPPCPFYFPSLSLSCLKAQFNGLWNAGPTWTWLNCTLMPTKQCSVLTSMGKYDTNRRPLSVCYC